MDNKKEKIEDFKTAISSTVRSLSNSQKIEVSFGSENSKSEKNLIKLPDLSPINNKINYTQLGEKRMYEARGLANLPKQTITNDNYGQQRLKNVNNQELNTTRMQGNILNAFKKNPYTQSTAKSS